MRQHGGNTRENKHFNRSIIRMQFCIPFVDHQAEYLLPSSLTRLICWYWLHWVRPNTYYYAGLFPKHSFSVDEHLLDTRLRKRLASNDQRISPLPPRLTSNDQRISPRPPLFRYPRQSSFYGVIFPRAEHLLRLSMTSCHTPLDYGSQHSHICSSVPRCQ